MPGYRIQSELISVSKTGFRQTFLAGLLVGLAMLLFPVFVLTSSHSFGWLAAIPVLLLTLLCSFLGVDFFLGVLRLLPNALSFASLLEDRESIFILWLSHPLSISCLLFIPITREAATKLEASSALIVADVYIISGLIIGSGVFFFILFRLCSFANFDSSHLSSVNQFRILGQAALACIFGNEESRKKIGEIVSQSASLRQFDFPTILRRFESIQPLMDPPTLDWEHPWLSGRPQVLLRTTESLRSKKKNLMARAPFAQFGVNADLNLWWLEASDNFLKNEIVQINMESTGNFLWEGEVVGSVLSGGDTDAGTRDRERRTVFLPSPIFKINKLTSFFKKLNDLENFSVFGWELEDVWMASWRKTDSIAPLGHDSGIFERLGHFRGTDSVVFWGPKERSLSLASALTWNPFDVRSSPGASESMEAAIQNQQATAASKTLIIIASENED